MRFSNKRASADVDAPSRPVHRGGPPARAGGPAVVPLYPDSRHRNGLRLLRLRAQEQTKEGSIFDEIPVQRTYSRPPPEQGGLQKWDIGRELRELKVQPDGFD